MKASVKFSLKKKAKIWSSIAWISIALVPFIIWILSALRKHNPAAFSSSAMPFIFMAAVITPIFIGVIAMGFGSENENKLKRYRLNIKAYRARCYALRIINDIVNNDMDNAVKKYNEFTIYPEPELRNMLFGFITHAMICNEKMKENGNYKLDEIRYVFDPSKINLD